MYLLDTNVVSELRRRKPHGGVLAWLAVVESEQLHIASITIGEIQAGIEKTRETDFARASEFETWLADVVANYRIISADAAIFRAWARIMHRRSDDLLEDALIAATATVRGLTIVSRDVADFRTLGLEALNPFAYRN